MEKWYTKVNRTSHSILDMHTRFMYSMKELANILDRIGYRQKLDSNHFMLCKLYEKKYNNFTRHKYNFIMKTY